MPNNPKIKRVSSNYILNKIQEADELFAQKNYSKALKNYEKILKEVSEKYAFDKFSLYNKIANCYKQLKKPKKQIDALEHMLNYSASNPKLWKDLGDLYSKSDIDKCIKYYQKEVDLEPERYAISGIAHRIIRCGEYSQRDVQQILEHNINLIRPILLKDKKVYEHTHHSKDANKKLKIGYLSSDFYSHAMMCFVICLLEHHNQQEFDFTLYSCSKNEDSTTKRIKATGMKFVDCSDLDWVQVAQKIYDDKIDILVDLGGYTHDLIWSLLLKPAPVQIQFLGFVGTYGMKEVDYILADRFTIPEGVEKYYTEKPLFLEHGMNRYDFNSKNTTLPDITPPPCIENDYITFGSFNNLGKISRDTVQLWADVLKAIPNSKFLIYRFPMADDDIERITCLFEEQNISKDRLIFDSESEPGAYFQNFSKCDIILDTIPYNGLTITIEAIMMGVPVLSLNVYDTFASKGAARINKIIGLKTFAAQTKEDFIKNAVLLCENLEILVMQRKTLRRFIQTSPLCTEYLQYAQEVEEQYKKAWQDYCNK